jgi:hypothetical protein
MKSRRTVRTKTKKYEIDKSQPLLIKALPGANINKEGKKVIFE